MKPRAERLVELLGALELDALLVTSPVNLRYLTGFTGSNGLALIGPDLRAFVTDFRYVEQAEHEVDSSFDRRRATSELLGEVAECLPSRALRLGFEDAHMTVRQHARVCDLLRPEIELIPAGTPVETLRRVKEPSEAAAIRAAAQLADDALSRVLAGGLKGRSEREIAQALERAMQELGASAPAFETIVAGGPQGALPHARAGDVPIAGGEMVVIDWGARLDGYCSDCTRTLAIGRPSAESAEVYELVLRAQQAGLGAIRPGAGAKAVDAAARGVIEAAGQGENFGHGLGHGVGLEVHEAPRLSQRSDDELAAGNTVTVEPGVYLPDRFGIRIEDLVLVNEDGCEILSSLPKDLVPID